MPRASSVTRLTPVTTPASLICWGMTLGGPHWNTGDVTWGSPLCIRYVTSRSPYHLPNFSHPTALHAPTTCINTKLFGPILKIGIASQPKPLTVRRPTVSDSGSRSSPHSVQRSLHRRDIPHWKFADYGTNNCWFPLARKWPTWKWTWIWIPYMGRSKKMSALLQTGFTRKSTRSEHVSHRPLRCSFTRP